MYDSECKRLADHTAQGLPVRERHKQLPVPHFCLPHPYPQTADGRVTGDAASCSTKSIEWGDVCTRGAGENAQCVVVGHPLEFWYRLGGYFCVGDEAATLLDDNNVTICDDPSILGPKPVPWASTDVVSRVNSRKGIDPRIFSAGSECVAPLRSAHPSMRRLRV